MEPNRLIKHMVMQQPLPSYVKHLLKIDTGNKNSAAIRRKIRSVLSSITGGIYGMSEICRFPGSEIYVFFEDKNDELYFKLSFELTCEDVVMWPSNLRFDITSYYTETSYKYVM